MLLYWLALKLAEDKEGDRDHQAARQQDKLLFVDALLAREIGACFVNCAFITAAFEN